MLWQNTDYGGGGRDQRSSSKSKGSSRNKSKGSSRSRKGSKKKQKGTKWSNNDFYMVLTMVV